MRAFENLGALTGRLYDSTQEFVDYVKEAVRAKPGALSHKSDILVGAIFAIPATGVNTMHYAAGLPVDPVKFALVSGDFYAGAAMMIFDALLVLGACVAADSVILNRAVISYLSKTPKEHYTEMIRAKK